MKFDPQIPIGKAVDNEHADGDDEVTGHGLIFDTGAPAASITPEPAETGRDAAPEDEDHRPAHDTE